jgi:hypothetical protein
MAVWQKIVTAVLAAGTLVLIVFLMVQLQATPV